MNVNYRELISLKLKCAFCVLTSIDATLVHVCTKTTATYSCYIYHVTLTATSLPLPFLQNMLTISSFLCVSGICDFAVSRVCVMKGKLCPMCLEENMQTAAKLHVVREEEM